MSDDCVLRGEGWRMGTLKTYAVDDVVGPTKAGYFYRSWKHVEVPLNLNRTTLKNKSQKNKSQKQLTPSAICTYRP